MKSKYLQEDLCSIAQELNVRGFGGSSILITGATGMIGSILIRGIIEYNKIYTPLIECIGLCRSSEKVAFIYNDEIDETGVIPNVKFIYQDITRSISKDLQCDYIVHTANSTSSKAYITNPVEVIDIIYNGSKSVFDYAVQVKAKGVVYLSSMEVFGRVYREARAAESELGYLDIQNIRSSYSEGKRLVECMAASYAEEYSLTVKVARLAQTFGAGIQPTDNKAYAQFARSAIKGEDIILHTKGQSFGNYCYTADVIKAILLLLKDGNAGDAYNVVNEETTRSIYELACLAADVFSYGKSKVVFDIPEDNIYGYAAETRLKLSSAKLNALGWKAVYNLKEMYERIKPDL